MRQSGGRKWDAGGRRRNSRGRERNPRGRKRNPRGGERNPRGSHFPCMNSAVSRSCAFSEFKRKIFASGGQHPSGVAIGSLRGRCTGSRLGRLGRQPTPVAHSPDSVRLARSAAVHEGRGREAEDSAKVAWFIVVAKKLFLFGSTSHPRDRLAPPPTRSGARARARRQSRACRQGARGRRGRRGGRLRAGLRGRWGRAGGVGASARAPGGKKPGLQANRAFWASSLGRKSHRHSIKTLSAFASSAMSGTFIGCEASPT